MLKNNRSKINIPYNLQIYLKNLLKDINTKQITNTITNTITQRIHTGMQANKKGEVQKHGFIWEKEIIQNVFRVPLEEVKKVTTYTGKFDLPAELNHIDGCDVSIKTTGSPNTVGMADALRVYDAICSGKSLHLIVLTYKQNKVTNTKTVSEIIEMDITGTTEMIDKLYKNVTRKDIEDLDNAVKGVPQNRKPTVEEHKAMYEIHKQLIGKTGEIYFNIKCDSEQSRLQCSFNKFLKFIEKNPDKIIARTNTNHFRGGIVSTALQSQCRVFKKKCNTTSHVAMEVPPESTNSQE
jgi:hypothetical protein